MLRDFRFSGLRVRVGFLDVVSCLGFVFRRVCSGFSETGVEEVSGYRL